MTVKTLRAIGLAFLLLAPAAQARVAIIIDNTNNNSTAGTLALRTEEWYVRNIGYQFVTGFLNRYNPGSYDTYTASQVWTQLIKDGKVSLTDRGSTTGPYKTYTGVIWVGTAGMSVSTNPNHVGCAACSLTFISNAATAAVPTVPQLFLGGIVEGETGFSASAACSTNCGGAGFDPGSQGPDYFQWRYHTLQQPGKGWPAQPGEAAGLDCFDGTSIARAAGTYRVIIGGDLSNVGGASPATVPAWRDSIYSVAFQKVNYGYTANATAPSYGIAVWVRYNGWPEGSGPANAKPNIFVHWGAHHTPVVGGGNTLNTDVRVQPDPVPIYIGMAFMDSVMGGAMLGTNYEPAKLAVQISGGFRRGLSTGPGGFAPDDTVNVGATLDSIKTLNIPFSVGVNVDSISAYASDLALWRRGGAPHFTLESWNGIADSTKGSGNASARPTAPAIVDPFGHFRKRIFVGSFSTTDTITVTARDSTDTSMVALLYRGRKLLRQQLRITDNDIDGVVIAARDDHLPVSNRSQDDSVGIALVRGGWVGVAQNADDSTGTSDIAPSRTNLWHASSNQHESGGALFLTHPGFNPRGATYGNGVAIVNDGAHSDSSWCMAYANRTMFSLYNPFWETPQKYHWLKPQGEVDFGGLPSQAMWWSEPGIHAEISPKSNIRTGTNLIRVTASSLGTGGKPLSPDRPGWFTLKYIKYQCDAINSFGKTLIVFTYPDGLSPKDFTR